MNSVLSSVFVRRLCSGLSNLHRVSWEGNTKRRSYFVCFVAEDPAGWLDWRLDEKEQLPVNSTARLVDVYRTVRYRQDAGVSVKINSASGVPGQ